jgi:uridine kinase
MTKLCIQPMFLIGLAIRLALIIVMAPTAVTIWYAPFLQVTTSVLTIDPWSTWINHGGSPLAFPYGYAMWLAFLPFTLIAKLVGLPTIYAYFATLLAADFALLVVLRQLIPKQQNLLLLSYWLSPIIILATYALGLNDLIPALLLFCAITLIRRIKPKLAGAFCAFAISAKFSMIVALPFFLIYLLKNRALRQCLPLFLFGFGVIALVLGVPFLLSSSAIQMLVGNPEMGKIYQLAINLTGNIAIYVVPLIYFVMLYMTWRVRRLNFDLFHATTGMVFLSIVLITPSSPGWFVWSIPFLVLYQAMSTRVSIMLVSAFSGLYILSALLVTHLQFSNGDEFSFSGFLHERIKLGISEISLFHTMLTAIGLLLAIKIWREAISKNDFFRLSRRPFVIAIAGDSGSGKDTVADGLGGLFGKHSVIKLSGDDYHLWDRQKPIWQVMTHLNPMANDLERFCNDLTALVDGKSVLTRHYDHQTGKLSKLFKIHSNDFIIASGLHTLYLPAIREQCNLKIYLDIDEGLRKHFKVQRDVHQRGRTLEQVLDSLEKREAESAIFIQPQSSHADLMLSLRPIHPGLLTRSDSNQPIRMKLVVSTQKGFNELSTHRILVGVCGLHVDVEVNDRDSSVRMTIEGEASGADIAMAADLLCPRVLEFLDISPQWQDGMLGLMQLFILSHVNQALTKRFIS